MYKCKYFSIQELVDPETYRIFGQRAWMFFDESALIAIDQLRGEFGPATINDWKWGGNYKWSGLRTKNCTIGAEYSLHRFGKAFDLKFQNFTAKEVRAHIKKKPDYWECYISRIENKVNWLHIDCANVIPLKWINP